MTYSIHVRVIQSKPTAWYSIVEKTAWHFALGATWREVDGEQILTMGDSGTSGLLRFENPQGDFFIVAVGVHVYKRWCDVVPDLKSTETGTAIHPTYYPVGNVLGFRYEIVQKQLATMEKKNSKGESIKVNYYKEDGNNLYATITIT
uniref:Lectin 3a n=1 Tax=Marchantia polymorpha TaxID=3197 RepID=A1DZ81_MARPO|nr:lectin 3a [Marchantia polymorpha]